MRANPTPLRLLLVEDSPADVFLVREAMQEAGIDFNMEVAEDGERAIHIIDQVDNGSASSCPNFIVLDRNLPRKTGDEVLKRVRRSPKCGNIPVVVITSSDVKAERDHALSLGATEYFCKPSNLGEFMQLGKLIRALHERNSANFVAGGRVEAI